MEKTGGDLNEEELGGNMGTHDICGINRDEHTISQRSLVLVCSLIPLLLVLVKV